jgi:hypothetical protein
MVDMKARVTVTTKMGAEISGMTREDFETVCEGRGWLKDITASLVTLVEQGLMDSFVTTLEVTSVKKKKK